MKKLFLSFAFAMLATSNAQAVLTCDLQSCATTINVDSGKVSKRCDASGPKGCACTLASQDCTVTAIAASSACEDLGDPGQYEDAGLKMNGTRCCVNSWNCFKGAELEQAVLNEAITSGKTQEELAEVYEANFSGERAAAYYGYVDGSIRSPNDGRTVSATAKLDACLFYSDVDALTGADNYEKWGNCVGTSVGCGATGKNEHCNATGMNDGVSVSAAVCKDRCDCVFGQGTCAGL